MKKIFWTVVLLGLLLFVLAVPSEYIVRSDARHAIFALDFHRYGVGLFPRLFGQPYPDYTATQSLLVTFSLFLLHSTSVFALSLPNLITSAIILWQTYILGAMHSKRWGAYAVIFLLLTSEFFTHVYSLGGDQTVIAVTLWVFQCLYSAETHQNKRYLFWVPVALLVGFAFRGSLGFIVPAAVIFGFYLANGDWKRLFSSSCISLSLLLVCTAVLLFLAFVSGGHRLEHNVWQMEFAQRPSSAAMYSLSAYFKDFIFRFSVSAPIAILLVFGLWKRLIFRPSDSRLKFLRYLAVWCGVLLFGMAIPHSHVHYILAVAPASALLAAYLFAERQENVFLIYLKKLLVWLFLLSSILAFIAFIVLKNHNKYVVLPHQIFILTVMGLISVLSLLTLLRIIFVRERTLASLVLFFLTYYLMNVAVVGPMLVARKGTKSFVEDVQTMQGVLVPMHFYKLPQDFDAISLVANARPYTRPVFVSDEQSIKSGVLYITSSRYVFPKNVKIKIRQKLFHQTFIAFEKPVLSLPKT